MKHELKAWAVFVGGIALEVLLSVIDFPKVVIHIPVEPFKEFLKDLHV